VLREPAGANWAATNVGVLSGGCVGSLVVSSVDDGDWLGTTTDVSRRTCEPTTITARATAMRSATAAASARVDRPLRPRARGKTSTATGIVPSRAVAFARRSISSHRSGASNRSRLAKRRRRSSTVITQKLAETPPAAAEVGPNGEAVRSEPVGDLSDWEVGVVEEDHGRTLAFRQPPDRGDQVVIGIGV
jgi:hypothetical protein